jgi:hypothetical protein
MDLSFGPEELAFQQAVRDFLEEALTDDIKIPTSKTTTVFVEKDIAL